MQKVQAAPAARRLIDGLRDLGYDFETAIADLVDNSLEADATEISINIAPRTGNIPAHVSISDDGIGIEREALIDVMRLGAAEDHSTKDLGKYGLGLKTASLSQANILTVASRAETSGARGKRHIARWNLNELDVKWDLQLLDDGDLRDWELGALSSKIANKHGTVVVWSDLDRTLLLDSDNTRERENALTDLTLKIERHLRMIFHRFIEHSIPGRRKVKIIVGDQPLVPSDPFCRSESTKELKVAVFPIPIADETAELRISPYVLPSEKEFSTDAAHDEAGWGNWNQKQGLYFYRNNRLIQAGGWSYLRTPDEHTKLLRVAVDFAGELDDALGVNVSKMRAKIPLAVREQVKNAVSGWAVIARKRYDAKSETGSEKSEGRVTLKSPKLKEARSRPFGAVLVSRGEVGSRDTTADADNGRVKLIVPESHPALDETSELKAFAAMLVELLASVAEGKLRAGKLPIGSLRRKLKELL